MKIELLSAMKAALFSFVKGNSINHKFPDEAHLNEIRNKQRC